MSVTTLVTGGSGMLGSSIKNLYETYPKHKNHKLLMPTSDELNLENKDDVFKYFQHNKIERVFHSAAKVGGIKSNIEYPAEFITKNLNINSNIFEASARYKISRLVFFGSSCIYPKNSKTPIKETSLMTGKLESSNYAYAVSKIAAISQCKAFNDQYNCDFRILMPSNLYGNNDNYDRENSHVIPALIHKFFLAIRNSEKFVEVWGTGKAQREFLHVDDLTMAAFTIMNLDKQAYEKTLRKIGENHINVGSGVEISIFELCKLLKKISKFEGKIVFNKNNLDGVTSKVLDSTNMKALGWNANISIEEGLKKSYVWFSKNYQNITRK